MDAMLLAVARRHEIRRIYPVEPGPSLELAQRAQLAGHSCSMHGSPLVSILFASALRHRTPRAAGVCGLDK